MASALTRFGIFCRDRRTASNKTMGDQADALNIDVSLVSAIETGAKTPSAEYTEQFGTWLSMNSAEMRELKRRAEAVATTFPAAKYIARNSNSVRLFRRISKMAPSQIRNFRKPNQNEVKDDDRL